MELKPDDKRGQATGSYRESPRNLGTAISPVRGSAKDTRLRIHLDRQANMVQTADGSPEEGAGDGRLDCSAPAILLRAKKSEVLLTAQIS